MVWIVQPQEISFDGEPTGRWRMTATSNEGGGGPHGDRTHSHASSKEAQECETCDRFISGVTGFPPRDLGAKNYGPIARAIAGRYDMPDGRKFWIDVVAAREIEKRVVNAVRSVLLTDQ